MSRSQLFLRDVCPTCPWRLPATEIHDLNKLHLNFLGSALHLQYGGNAVAFSIDLLFTKKVFGGRDFVSLTPHNESLLQWDLQMLLGQQTVKAASSSLRRWWSTVERKEMNAVNTGCNLPIPIYAWLQMRKILQRWYSFLISHFC